MKNILVFAAPGTAGLLGRPGDVARTAAAAAIFLVASAGTYLLNDAADAASDRAHPDKRHRPVASGELPATLAIAVGCALVAASIAGAGMLAGVLFVAILAGYVAVSVTYTLWLKRVAVIELACVSAGFVLRAVAGGAVNHISISPWFAITTSAAAFMVVAGKRSSEMGTLGPAVGFHRVVLEQYSKAYLRSVRMVAAGVAILSFCLWAFQRGQLDVGHGATASVLFELSIIPFVLGIFSVELAIDTGKGGAPEELVMHDRSLQVLGIACVALIASGIYV